MSGSLLVLSLSVSECQSVCVCLYDIFLRFTFLPVWVRYNRTVLSVPPKFSKQIGFSDQILKYHVFKRHTQDSHTHTDTHTHTHPETLTHTHSHTKIARHIVSHRPHPWVCFSKSEKVGQKFRFSHPVSLSRPHPVLPVLSGLAGPCRSLMVVPSVPIGCPPRTPTHHRP